MSSFTFPITFGALAAGNQPLSDVDQDFTVCGNMGTIACSVVGTNTLTLTSLTGYPTITALSNYQKVGFIAANTTTTLTTIGCSGLSQYNAYANDGLTQITTGSIIAGYYYEFAFVSTLNSSAGGWQQTAFNSNGIFPGTLTAGGFNTTSTVTVANGLYLPAANTPAIAANSNPVAEFLNVGSANYITLENAATNGTPAISVVGSDTNIQFSINSKGTNGVALYTGGGPQFFAANAASSVNYVIATGSATGNAVSIGSQGSDTNINLSLMPQGTGKVQFGTSASFAANSSTACSITSIGPAGAHTTVQKWLTILDNSGNPFYIPCF